MRFLALVFALLLAAGAWAAGQKLVMKDGSYQVVRSYERQGDRVRYFSLERHQWEEAPASLVDWEATEESDREEKASAAERAERAGNLEEDIAKENFGHEIAPGLRLPEKDGVFVVREGAVVALTPQQASARVDKKRLATNVLIPIPILKNRSLVEIPGERAAVRLKASPAELFANGKVAGDSRYALVRLKAKKGKREVQAILTNIIGRNPKHAGDYIELKAETLARDVYRLVPASPLPAGEYAIVEFIGDDLNVYVWDFAVDPLK